VTLLSRRHEILGQLLPADEYAIRLTVDTNTLIDNPHLAAHVGTLGPRYLAHLLPVVLREIDDLKRDIRTQDLREAAKRADRRFGGSAPTETCAQACGSPAACTLSSSTSNRSRRGDRAGWT